MENVENEVDGLETDELEELARKVAEYLVPRNTEFSADVVKKGGKIFYGMCTPSGTKVQIDIHGPDWNEPDDD